MLKKYLLYSSVAVVLVQPPAISSFIELKLFYFFLIVNLPLLLFFWDFRIQKHYAAVLAYVWISGFLEVAFGPDLLRKYLMEAVGITAASFYFYLFFKQENHSVEEIFDLYARGAVWICLFGIAVCAVESIVHRHFIPVRATFGEPAGFAASMIPAFYYFASNRRLTEKRARMRVLIVGTALVLSFSATGMIGLMVSVALLLRRKSWTLFFAPIAVGLIFLVLYSGSEHFRIRVNDTAQSASTLNVSNANLSTYALVSNAYVAVRAIQERPIFGYGVGGHAVAHAKYIGDLPGADALGDFLNLNAQDANSWFLRTMSEFGFVGVVFTIFFFFKFWTPGYSVYGNIGAAVFVYCILALLRAGQWFEPERYFFLWIYVLVWRDARRALPASTQSASRARPAPAKMQTIGMTGSRYLP